MLKKRILASSMASVMALSGISVAAFADEETTKKYGEAVTKEELQTYVESLKDFIDTKLENYGSVQAERFESVIDYANNVIEDKKATDSDATAAYQMIKSVKDNLVIKTSAELAALIKKWQGTYETDNELNIDFHDNIYTNETWDEFADAFTDAEHYVDSDSSMYITDAYIELERTAGKLDELKTVTKREFEAVKAKYQDIKIDMKEYEPWRRFTLTVAPKTGTSSNKGKLVSNEPAVSMGDLNDMLFGSSTRSAYYFDNGKWAGLAAAKVSDDDKKKGHTDTEGKWIGNYDADLTIYDDLEDFVMDRYNDFVEREGVTVTSDPTIIAAYEAAQDAVNVYAGKQEDANRKGSEGKVETLLKKYHNKLVLDFNMDAVDKVQDFVIDIDGADGDKVAKFKFDEDDKTLVTDADLWIVTTPGGVINTAAAGATGVEATDFYTTQKDASDKANLLNATLGGHKAVKLTKNKTDLIDYLPIGTILNVAEWGANFITRVSTASGDFLLPAETADKTSATKFSYVSDATKATAYNTAVTNFKSELSTVITGGGTGANAYKLLCDNKGTGAVVIKNTDVPGQAAGTKFKDRYKFDTALFTTSDAGIIAALGLSGSSVSFAKIVDDSSAADYGDPAGAGEADAIAKHNKAIDMLKAKYDLFTTANTVGNGVTDENFTSAGTAGYVSPDDEGTVTGYTAKAFSDYKSFKLSKSVTGAANDMYLYYIVKVGADDKVAKFSTSDSKDVAAMKHNAAVKALIEKYKRLEAVQATRCDGVKIADRLNQAMNDYAVYSTFDKKDYKIADYTDAAENIMVNIDEDGKSLENVMTATINDLTIGDGQPRLYGLTDNGPQLKGYTESSQEWTLIWRDLVYALEDMYPEDAVYTDTLRDLKKLIDEDSLTWLEKTADSTLFEEQHQKLFDKREEAIDFYATNNKTVNPNFEKQPGASKAIHDAVKALNDQVSKVQKQFNDFKYSYGDIRDTIAEVAAALEANEVSGDKLTKALADTANKLAIHEWSQVDNDGEVTNDVFDDYGEFQHANRLKTNNKEFAKIKPNDFEKDLLKSYENLMKEFEAAKTPAGEKTNDLNGDGKVNVLDVQALLKVAVDGTTDLKYDINDDKSVNVLDVQALLKIALAD